MRVAAVFAAGALLLAGAAHAADARAVVSIARQRIETADYRATGRLVNVDANGNRVTNSISLMARWIAGSLHTLIEIVPAKGQPHAGPRLSILLETLPNGQNSIRIFRPHQPAGTLLPFDQWDQAVLGGMFSYEDFLQPEFFWPGQAILKTARFGARQCHVLKSTPGAADRTHYAEVQTWLDQTINYPVYAEKTLKSAPVVKQFTSFNLRKAEGVWAAMQVEAQIRGRSGSSFLIIDRGSAKANLSLKDFSPQQISRFEDHP
jgi:hypothetical protein